MFKKIISILVAVSFMLSDISFAYDAVHLAPPIILDDIADGTPYNKDFILAEMAFEMDLAWLLERRDIRGVKDLAAIKEAFKDGDRFKEDIILDEHTAPTRIERFYNDIEQLGPSGESDIFAVCFNLTRRNKPSRIRLLFSTTPQGDNLPIRPCTEDEYKGIKAKVAGRMTLPERKAEAGTEARARYREHERYDKEVIAWAQNNGRGIKMEQGLFRTFLRKVSEFTNIEIEDNPSLRKIENRKCYLYAYEDDKRIPDELRNRIFKYTMTVRAEDGTVQSIPVFSHSSNEAFHMLLPRKIVDALLNTIGRDAAGALYVAAERQFQIALAHELGAVCDQPVLSVSAQRCVNEASQRYLQHSTSGMAPRDTLNITVTDLDTNLATRDYAYSEAASGKMEDILAVIGLALYEKPFTLQECLESFASIERNVFKNIQPQYEEAEVFHSILEEFCSAGILEKREGQRYLLKPDVYKLLLRVGIWHLRSEYQSNLYHSREKEELKIRFRQDLRDAVRGVIESVRVQPIEDRESDESGSSGKSPEDELSKGARTRPGTPAAGQEPDRASQAVDIRSLPGVFNIEDLEKTLKESQSGQDRALAALRFTFVDTKDWQKALDMLLEHAKKEHNVYVFGFINSAIDFFISKGIVPSERKELRLLCSMLSQGKWRERYYAARHLSFVSDSNKDRAINALIEDAKAEITEDLGPERLLLGEKAYVLHAIDISITTLLCRSATPSYESGILDIGSLSNRWDLRDTLSSHGIAILLRCVREEERGAALGILTKGVEAKNGDLVLGAIDNSVIWLLSQDAESSEPTENIKDLERSLYGTDHRAVFHAAKYMRYVAEEDKKKALDILIEYLMKGEEDAPHILREIGRSVNSLLYQGIRPSEDVHISSLQDIFSEELHKRYASAILLSCVAYKAMPAALRQISDAAIVEDNILLFQGPLLDSRERLLRNLSDAGPGTPKNDRPVDAPSADKASRVSTAREAAIAEFPDLRKVLDYSAALFDGVIAILQDSEVRELAPTVTVRGDGNCVIIGMQNPAKEEDDVRGFKLEIKSPPGISYNNFWITPFWNGGTYKGMRTDNFGETVDITRKCLVQEKRKGYWREWLNAARAKTRQVETGTGLDGDAMRALDRAWEILDENYFGEGTMDHEKLLAELNTTLIEAGIGRIERLDDKMVLILSKTLTFDYGIGALLPRLIKAGIIVGVVVTDERQRAVITDWNKRIKEEMKVTDNRIFCGTNIGEVISDARSAKINISRYQYLKVKEDKDAGENPKWTLDITAIVQRIIKILGRLCDIVEPNEKLDRMQEAANTFRRAA